MSRILLEIVIRFSEATLGLGADIEVAVGIFVFAQIAFIALVILVLVFVAPLVRANLVVLRRLTASVAGGLIIFSILNIRVVQLS